MGDLIDELTDQFVLDAKEEKREKRSRLYEDRSRTVCCRLHRARRLHVDPAEVRRVNLIPSYEIPYDTGLKAYGTQVVYDSGDYERLLKESMDRFGYEEAKRRAADARAGRAVGVGVSFFVEKSGLGPWEYSRGQVEPHGCVTVFTGAADLGQGLETLLSQIVADEIGADYEQVRVVHGDTEYPFEMFDAGAVERVQGRPGLDMAEVSSVLGGNAENLLGQGVKR